MLHFKSFFAGCHDLHWFIMRFPDRNVNSVRARSYDLVHVVVALTVHEHVMTTSFTPFLLAVLC